jgi:uncharacterized OB-fold protein
MNEATKSERPAGASMISERPIPLPDDATAPFWEACRRRELVMQRCAGCGALRFPPRPMCPRCQSLECDWAKASGRGTIYSFVIIHPPVLPAFAARTPFPVVLVALDDGPALRMIGNLVEDPGARLQIGARVEVAFEDVAADVTLPQWRLI